MRNRAPSIPAVLLLILSAGCGIIDLEPPGEVTTNPGAPNQIMEPGEEISVTFPRTVDTAAAESAIRILSGGGSVFGTFTWNGARAVFVPEEELKIGNRYELIVEGTVPGTDGRVLTPRVYIPFYSAVLPDEPPRIISVEPAVLGEKRTVITVSFSLPMDRDSLEVTSDPEADLEPVWRPGERVLDLVPGTDYPNGEIVELSFSDSAADNRGVPLTGIRDYRLPVAYDTCRPRVETIGYSLSDWQAGFPVLGTDLDSIGPADALRISFSEPMDPVSTEAGISLFPDPFGHRTWISVTDYVIVPELGWEAGTEYLLTIGPPAADTGGNPLEVEVIRGFAPRFEVFALESIRPLPADGPPLTCFSTVDPLVITPALYGGDYTFQFEFSQPAPSDDIKNAVQRRVSVRSLYPHSLPTPRITGLSWPDYGSLTVSLTGFERSSPGRRCFYSIEVGAVREAGLETVTQLIEASE